jgi:deoxyribonuclease V
MKVVQLHSWNISPVDAVQIQKQISKKIKINDTFDKIYHVAGADVGYKGGMAVAAVMVFSFPQLEEVERVVRPGRVTFPYISGLLSFREIPALLKCFQRLKISPDIILVDGQGIAHPRRVGLASHLGLFLEVPTIGCAKSRLWGTYEEPAMEYGSYEYLYDKGDIIGAALRTRSRVKEVFVSSGHHITLDSSIKTVLSCCRKFRLPEPIRRAHQAVSKM